MRTFNSKYECIIQSDPLEQLGGQYERAVECRRHLFVPRRAIIINETHVYNMQYISVTLSINHQISALRTSKYIQYSLYKIVSI